MAVRGGPCFYADLACDLDDDLGAKVVAANVRDVSIFFFEPLDVSQYLAGGWAGPHDQKPLTFEAYGLCTPPKPPFAFSNDTR